MKRNLATLFGCLPAAILVSCTPSDDEIVVYDKVGGTVPNILEAIDLGLSVIWAPWNIGASKASDYGEYFAWGEVAPKLDESGNYLSYDWKTYYWIFGGQSDWQNITKYQTDDTQYSGIWYNENQNFIGDGKTTLEDSDDAATVNWGGRWRMPTQAEFEELSNTDNCEWTWTDNYKESNHSGYVIKSKKNGYEEAVLFLPAAGARFEKDLYCTGGDGFYWSSSLDSGYSNFALGVYFYSDDCYNSFDQRCCGFSVRAVCSRSE